MTLQTARTCQSLGFICCVCALYPTAITTLMGTHMHLAIYHHAYSHPRIMVCVLIVVGGAPLRMLLANASPPPSNH